MPKRHDPDASLESVDLDDPENLENPENSDLEAFLNKPDNQISADALFIWRFTFA